MTHQEFISAHGTRSVRVTVDRSLATRLIDTPYMPGWCSAVQMLFIFGRIVCGLFGLWALVWFQEWYWLAVVLVGAGTWAFKSRVEAWMVVRSALRDKKLYDLVIDQKIIELDREQGEPRT